MNENNTISNAEIIKQLQEVSAARKAKREECLKIVTQAWADYANYRRETYKPAREALLKQLTDKRAARELARQEKLQAMLEKAEELKKKMEEKEAEKAEASSEGKAAA